MNLLELIKSMNSGSTALGNSSSDGGLAKVFQNIASGATTMSTIGG